MTISLPVVDNPTPCYGKATLFESTYVADQRAAAKLCKGNPKANIPGCPIILECRTRLDEAVLLAIPSFGPEGTWAGLAVGNDKRRKDRGPSVGAA